MAVNILYPNPHSVDPGDDLGYPTTTDALIFKGPNNQIQLLAGAGVPGSNHNNADNGSLYVDITNFVLHIKTAASTWTIVGTQS